MRTSDLFAGRTARIVLLATASCFCAGQAARADDCLTRPNRAAAGGHWYYRVDHATHRKCWYLKGGPIRSTAAVVQPGPDAGARPGAVTPGVPTSAQANDPPVFMKWLSSMVGGAQPPDPALREAAADPDKEQVALAPPPRRAVEVRRPHRPKMVSQKAADVASARPDSSSEQADPPLDETKRAALFQEFLRWRLQQQLIGLHAADSAQD